MRSDEKIKLITGQARGRQAELTGRVTDAKEKASMQREKKRLLEAFCPKSPKWRKTCCELAIEVVQQTQKLLEECSA